MEIITLFLQLKNITSDNANFTAQEQNDVINNITQNIVNVTQTALTTSDVITINNIVDKSIVILTSNIGDKSITNPFLETVSVNVVQVNTKPVLIKHDFFIAPGNS